MEAKVKKGTILLSFMFLMLDNVKGKSNEYTEKKWDNKNENSTSWRSR